MKIINLYWMVIVIFCAGLACKAKNPQTAQIKNTTGIKKKQPDTVSKKPAISPDSVQENDYNFIADSIFHGYKEQLAYYYEKYDGGSCSILINKEDFRRVITKRNIGSIRKGRQATEVFVLYPLNSCISQDGQAYYFSDTSLPRLTTDSYCCNPKSLFPIGDIDGDGISEIGEYYSSCASRYKSLHVYSLKDDHWKEVGHCTYDLMYSEKKASYKRFIRKTGRGKFEMLEVTDLTEKENVGKKVWLKFQF